MEANGAAPGMDGGHGKGSTESVPGRQARGFPGGSSLIILCRSRLLGTGMRSFGTRIAQWLVSPPVPSSEGGQPGSSLPPGWQPIAEHAPEDVFVVGYPKSGNTWVQCLLAAAVYGLDIELAPVSIVRELVPDVHDQPVYRRYSSPMYFKSHALPDPGYRRVIYLLRDGRDVMVSYRHYLEAILGRELDLTRLVKTGEELFPCKWAVHVTQWLGNPHGCELTVLRFEDLKRDPLGELRRICLWMGVERDESVLEKAVRQTSFEALRKWEARWNTAGRWPREKHFFRRGVAGGHTDEMPAEAREAFWAEAGDLLVRLGYATGPDRASPPLGPAPAGPPP